MQAQAVPNTKTPTALALARGQAHADAVNATNDALREVEKLRRALAIVEDQLISGLRVSASVSGEAFIASDARNLVRALDDRQRRYDTLALLDGIAS